MLHNGEMWGEKGKRRRRNYQKKRKTLKKECSQVGATQHHENAD